MTLLLVLAWALVGAAALTIGAPALLLVATAAFIGGYALGRMGESVARQRER